MIALVNKYAHKPEDQWAPLFYRMLKNRTTDHHRGGAVHRRIFAWFSSDAEDGNEDPIEQFPARDSDRPEDRFTQQLAADNIVQAVEKLPVRQREAFMFRAWEGMDVKATAVAMGCSTGSVKTHYSRAVKALQVSLGGERND